MTEIGLFGCIAEAEMFLTSVSRGHFDGYDARLGVEVDKVYRKLLARGSYIDGMPGEKPAEITRTDMQILCTIRMEPDCFEFCNNSCYDMATFSIRPISEWHDIFEHDEPGEGGVWERIRDIRNACRTEVAELPAQYSKRVPPVLSP